MKPLAVQNIQLRRALLASLQARATDLDAALKTADYEQWVKQVNAKIAAINTRIRTINAGPAQSQRAQEAMNSGAPA